MRIIAWSLLLIILSLLSFNVTAKLLELKHGVSDPGVSIGMADDDNPAHDDDHTHEIATPDDDLD